LQNKSHYYFIAADKVRRSASALRPIRRHFQLISQQAESATVTRCFHSFICSFIHEKTIHLRAKKGTVKEKIPSGASLAGRHVTAGTAPNLNALERPLKTRLVERNLFALRNALL
jgi:hypothetical protein